SRHPLVELLEGRALLSGPGDDFGDDFADAQPLVLGPSGPDPPGGAIERAGDVDFFRFESPASGLLTVRQSAAPGVKLDNVLTVSAAAQPATPTNADADGALNSRVSFRVVAGQIYYLRAAGYGDSTGRYVLKLGMDDPPVDPPRDPFAGAFPVPLGPDGSVA